jgi:uncharacterized protein with PIN domain
MGRSSEFHSFHCINCGNKAYELVRKKGHQYPKFHRKKMYCPFCKEEINMVECKNPMEVFEFKEDFERGVYNEEAKESLAYVRMSSLG